MITRVPWENSHDDLLRISAGDDLEIIKRQVQDGIAQLWECRAIKCCGYVVTRIDEGPELCIVLGEGVNLMVFAPFFVDYAKRRKMKIRTHVKRRGLIRMWGKFGLELDEYVLRG